MAYGTSSVNYAIPYPRPGDIVESAEEQKRENSLDYHLYGERFITGNGAVQNDGGDWTQLRLGTVIEAGRWFVRGLYCQATGTSIITGVTNGTNITNYIFAAKSNPWTAGVSFRAKTGTTETSDEYIIGTMNLNGGVVTGVVNSAILLGHPPVQVIDGWWQDNVAASQNAVVLSRWGTGAAFPTSWVAVRRGSLTGISVKSNEARTAGTASFEVYVNAVATGLRAVLDATNTTLRRQLQFPNTDSYVNGDEVDVRMTTSSAWTPTTADVRVNIEVSHRLTEGQVA